MDILTAANTLLHSLDRATYDRDGARLGEGLDLPHYIHFHGNEPHLHPFEPHQLADAERFLLNAANLQLEHLTPTQASRIEATTPALTLDHYVHFHGTEPHITRSFTSAADAALFTEALKEAPALAPLPLPPAQEGSIARFLTPFGEAGRFIGNQFDSIPTRLRSLSEGKGLSSFDTPEHTIRTDHGLHLHAGQPLSHIATSVGLAYAGGIAASNIQGLPWIGQVILKTVAAWPMINAFIGPELSHAVMHAKHGENLQDIAKYGLISLLMTAGLLKKDDAHLSGAASLMSGIMAAGGRLESHALDEAAKAIHELRDLLPKEADVVHGDHTHRQPVESLTPGMVIALKPGDIIPANLTLLTQTSPRTRVDSMLYSGQSGGQEVLPGDRLLQGGIVMEGTLHARVDAPAKDSFIEGKLTAAAQDGKPPTQSQLESIVNSYVYLLIAGAAGATAVGSLRGAFKNGNFDPRGINLAQGFTEGAELAVKASPCAVLVGPAPYGMAQQELAGQHGIFLLDKGAIEHLSHTNLLLTDLTGTLTQGRTSITDVIAMDAQGHPIDPTPLLQGASALETVAGKAHPSHAPDQHPAARALIRHAEENHIVHPTIFPHSSEAIQGIGVTGHWQDKPLAVGRASLMPEVPAPLLEAAQNLQSQGKSVTFIRHGTSYALYATEDTLRPDVARTLETMKARGIDVRIMTGQHPETTRKLAHRLGIPADHIHAGLLPEEKEALVYHYRHEGNHVAVLGDHTNDTLAFQAARASLKGIPPGIAYVMQDTGHAATRAQASAVLNGIQDIPVLMDTAQQVQRLSWTNIVVNALWSGLLTLRQILFGEQLGLPVAALAHEGPVAATLATSAALTHRIVEHAKPDTHMGHQGAQESLRTTGNHL